MPPPAVPSYSIRSLCFDHRRNTFYEGDVVHLNFCHFGEVLTSGSFTGGGTTPAPFTGEYWVRDYYGNLVANGTIVAQPGVTVGVLAPGWYKIFFTQSVNDAYYGFAAGSATFTVLTTDTRFPLLKDTAPFNGFPWAEPLPYERGAVMVGLGRYVVPNSESVTTVLSNIVNSVNQDLTQYLDPARQDPVRPRRYVVLFVANAANSFAASSVAGKAGITNVVQTLCNTFGPDLFAFEGPFNESTASGANLAIRQQEFYNCVKAANPSAYVIGPCLVSVGDASRVRLTGFFAAASVMSPVPMDAFSFHFYNNMNGDLTMGRRSMDTLLGWMTAVGLQHLPLFQTEQGYRTYELGNAMYHWSGEWYLMMLLLFDQYGLPKENCFFFQDQFFAPWGMIDNGQNFVPAAAFMHQFASEVFGKVFAESLDFGEPGNEMMIGNRYHDPTSGADVIALMATGVKGATIEFTVPVAGASFTQADCFGNETTVTASGLVLTVDAPLQPTYLRVPAGTTLVLRDQWTIGSIAQNLATGAVVATSGGTPNQVNAPRMINAVQENVYYGDTSGSGRNDPLNPYIDDTNAYPSWVQLTWRVPTRVDRAIIFCEQPTQAYGTLLDFEVQTWDGAAWVTQEHVIEKAQYGEVTDPSANVLFFPDAAVAGSATIHSFVENRWIFDVPFAAVTTTKLRILVHSATYGQAPTLEAFNALVGDRTAFGNNFTIRELQAYCSDLAAPRYVVVP